MEIVKVMQESWDYLVILDACRYDYFEQVWQKYLTGTLEKKISPASSTTEWRGKAFPGYFDDIVYISANPYINSLGTAKGYRASDHFSKVYDLWLHDWDQDEGTVMPEKVTQRAIEIIPLHPDKRVIIHYMQPHEPYISRFVPSPGYEAATSAGLPPGVNKEEGTGWAARWFTIIFRGVLYWLGIRGNYLRWKIAKLLHVPPSMPMEAVWRKYDDEILRRLYKESLEIALEHVAKLVEGLTGRIVITADHGEMLGEDNCYCHWSRSNNKFLREIPWLVIDKGKRTVDRETQVGQTKHEGPQPTQPADEDAKKKIQERLRALGYFD